MLRAVQFVALVFGQGEARQQTRAQERTEAKELVGDALLIDKMFFGPEDRMGIQQPVQAREGFADRTRHDVRMQDTLLLRHLGVDRHRTVVIARGARGERAEPRTGLEPEALSVGGGPRAIAPHSAQGHVVMRVDQRGGRGFQRRRPQAPLRHLLEHVRGAPFDTLGHRRQPERRAGGHQGRK